MGKLNILKHKSWNVYSIKNQERVKRDEEAHAAQEAEEEEKRLRVQQQARLDQLRAAAKGKSSHGIISSSDVATTDSTVVGSNHPHLLTHEDRVETISGSSSSGAQGNHIHLFAEEERSQHFARNPNAGKSQREIEHEKWAKQFKNYLGETRDGKRQEGLWWSSQSSSLSRDSSTALSSKEKDRRDAQDPMLVMKRQNLGSRGHSTPSSLTAKGSSSRPSVISISSSSKASISSGDKLELLRRERMERERLERERALGLINPNYSREKAEAEAQILRHQETSFYHSQFNPDHVKARRDRHRPAPDRRHPSHHRAPY